MADEKSKGIKILGWILAVFAFNDFITYVTSFYFYNFKDYSPPFLMYYTGLLFSYTFYDLIFIPQILTKLKLYLLCRTSIALLFIYSVLFLISSIGILNFKNWARKLMIACLFFLFLLMCTSFYYKFHEINTFGKILYLFKTLILLYPIIYLTHPKVRELFK